MSWGIFFTKVLVVIWKLSSRVLQSTLLYHSRHSFFVRCSYCAARTSSRRVRVPVVVFVRCSYERELTRELRDAPVCTAGSVHGSVAVAMPGSFFLDCWLLCCSFLQPRSTRPPRRAIVATAGGRMKASQPRSSRSAEEATHAQYQT